VSGVRKRTKILFAFCSAFLGFFLFGVTDYGQRVLRGEIPPNASHWQRDDIYMGAGLAPWVYGLVPGILLLVIAIGSLAFDGAKAEQNAKR
jgi:hypothetical protein